MLAKLFKHSFYFINRKIARTLTFQFLSLGVFESLSMFGDALPIRYSRRIQRKAIHSPVNVTLKYTRRSAIKRRKLLVNSSIPKATEKTNVFWKSKLKKDSKQASGHNSHLLEVTKKSKVKKKSNLEEKSLKSFKMLLAKETENLTLDILSQSDFTPIDKRNISKKCSSNSDSKSSKRKFLDCATEIHVSNEKIDDSKKREKINGNTVSVDNSTNPSKYITMKKNVSPVKTDYIKKPKVNRNNGYSLIPSVSMQCEIDVLTMDSCEKPSQRRARSVSHKNKINCLAIDSERKKKSTDNDKKKSVKKAIQPVIPQTINNASFSDTNSKKTLSDITSQKRNLTPNVNLKSNFGNNELCYTADLYKMKHRRANMSHSKMKEHIDIEFLSKIGTSTYQKRRFIKTLAPIKFNLNTESDPLNSVKKELSQLPIDCLTNDEGASCSQNDGERLVINLLTPYIDRKKILSWPHENELSSKISAKNDIPNLPIKGTLKHKRWLLNNLKERNAGYEDDIFENYNFGLNNTAFHFGDESDHSSMSIVTPKFECMLTPTRPRKTPRFKDCISPTELLQARKTAEEYLYRRKKRKSENEPISSRNKANMNKENTTCARKTHEETKGNFEEPLNELITLQKEFEKNAEIDDGEADFYFSDAST